MADTFKSEAEFETALVNRLKDFGWTGGVLHQPDEQDLLDNWAQILYKNNPGIDRLNGCPLTQGEMQQILEQIAALRTPMRLNGFINGRTVSIKRDNSDDATHFGKEVSLYIYDRLDIAAGRSVYQIAEQPRFKAASARLNDRRGDVTLLINGMPLIHIELKRSGVPVSQACNQIQKYAHEGVFSGLFSLVQIFVAMEPAETVYFANPGATGDFSLYRFHWADFNNEPINDWNDVVRYLLSIPMAHQLIGFYSVADDKDATLKVMRSYQYYAASAISDRVRKSRWDKESARGGYVWHTTGSGKTMTSFKSAQLIADSRDADKVVFLVDRIELGTQSLDEYRNFADDSMSVQATEDTDVLRAKLKSDDYADTLIVTSIQKMSNIHEHDGGLTERDLERIRDKRIVFIVDECHRSTFGDMMQTIRRTFPTAMLFGFTGTPIQDENQKKQNTTTDVFGDELHRYSIADGIRDHNVLAFDPYMVCTYKDRDVRSEVALEKARADSEDDALADPTKRKAYLRYMDPSQVPMAGHREADSSWSKGIEDWLPESQYRGTDGDGCTDGTPCDHFRMVFEDIVEGWTTLSHGGKFHAILATSSIPEAITYYRMFRDNAPHLKVTALFDPNIGNDNPDNPTGTIFKEDGLIEILDGYSKLYPGKDYTIPTHATFKRDVSARLAHKKPYVGIERHPEEQLDLLIVVNQMLTGFDSKWVNTLYLDKVLEYEGLIQAFSRTNRVFPGNEKPFGVIRYYRRPHTMRQNVGDAVRLYSGDRPFGLFVDKLESNLEHINICFEDIRGVFEGYGVKNFERLPDSDAACARFAKLFKQLSDLIEAAKVQGFTWGKSTYKFHRDGGEETEVVMALDQQAYLVLALRYKELFEREPGDGSDDVPFDIDGYLTEIDTGRIDTDYMNENFAKWLKKIDEGEEAKAALELLHSSFASLTQEQQAAAELVIHAAQRGELEVVPGKTLMDYINDFQKRGKDSQVNALVSAIGVDEGKLRDLMARHVTEDNINEYGRFDALKETADLGKARDYFTGKKGKPIPPFKVSMRLDKLLREFVIQGGFEI
jgi:type I restriction enzyme R subunit